MRTCTLCLCFILAAGLAASASGITASGGHNRPLAPSQVEAKASYRIDVTLDPAAKTLDAHQTLTYANTSADALSVLPFHLYLNAFAGPDTTFMRESGGTLRGDQADPNAPGWITVSGVRLGEADLSGRLAYNDDRTVMTVTLPAPLAPGATLALDIDFQARLPRVFARTGWWDDDFFMVGQWFPKIAVYDDLGWHSWPFHGLAEFFADFGTYEVSITLPSAFVVGATGYPRGSRDNGDGTKTESYYAEQVIDFAWTASPHYQTATRQWNDVDIVLLYQAEHRAYVERYLTTAQRALEFYGQRIGPYAYKRLTLVDPPSAATGAGGMEYPMFFTAGTGMLGLPELPGSTLYELEVVTLHEAAHNWFGMVVATNEAEEPWLDEGFTDFVATEAASHYYGTNTSMLSSPWLKLGYLDMRRMEYLAMPYVPSYGKAWEFSLMEYAIGTYSKPVMSLTTLKNILGEELFWRVLQAYYTRYQFKHPRSEDFIAVAEEISGQQLDWFFAASVYGRGALDYAVEELASERQADGTYRTRVVVSNQGQAALPVEVRVAFADGTYASERWDGQASRTFTYERTAPAAWAQVDPDRTLALERRWLNNSRTLRPQQGPLLRLGSRVLFWLQNVLITLGGM